MNKTIACEYDIFDGITLNANTLPNNPIELERVLECCLTEFEARNKRIVWITLSIDQSHLISVFTEKQFHFHNCHDDRLTLTRCLKNSNDIPFKPTHTIGAGAVVTLGDSILVVKETLSSSKGYKLPGGHMELGESIAETAVREVHEETGINARFCSVNGLVNKFPYRFEKANIYFVCRLEAITQEIQIHHPDEIAEAKWINIQEYLGDANNGEFNRAAARAGFYSTGMQIQDVATMTKTADKREVLFS